MIESQNAYLLNEVNTKWERDKAGESGLRKVNKRSELKWVIK